MVRSSGTLAAVGAMMLLAATGCGSSAVLTGDVTYDGQPVEKGAITFFPTDGLGPTTGAEIRGGRYRVDGAPPGPKIVQIEGFREVPSAVTSEEMSRQAEEAMRRGVGAAPLAEYNAAIIPANAEGNNETIEIKSGRRTLDFHLNPPGRNR